MTNEEFDKLCKELLAQGMTEKDILGVILQMFEDGKIDIEGMKKLAGARGYELTEEFINKASAPAGEGEAAPAEGAPEGVTSEEVEDAQEVEPGEESEKTESEGGEEKEEGSESEESESTGSEESEEESEEDEKKKARELYDLD